MFGVHVSICPSVCPSLCLSIWLSVYLCIYLSLCIHLSISIFISLHQTPARMPDARVRVCMRFDSIHSAFGSAAVSTNAKGSKAQTDSRSDSRADRPRRYRVVHSAGRHMCSSRRCRACARARLCAPTLPGFCATALTRAVMVACGRACLRACVRARVRLRACVHACACLACMCGFDCKCVCA